MLPAGEVGIVAISPAVVETTDPNSSHYSQAASISELNQAFIASANNSQAEDVPLPAPLPLSLSPRFASAPSSPVGPQVGPPEHPLLARLDHSSFFFTPTPPAQEPVSGERNSTESPPTSESSPNRTRRKLDFAQKSLSEYDQSTPPNAHGSGEVGDIVASAEPSAHAILNTSADGAEYTVQTGLDSIPIERIAQLAAGGESLPSGSSVPADLSSTSTAADTQHDLRPKSRLRNERARSVSNEAYPSARVDKVKNALRRNSEQNDDEDESSKMAQSKRHRYKGKDGRFQRKPPANE